MSNHTLVFSIALGDYKELFSQCIKSQERYCENHGYTFVCVDSAPRDMKAEEAAWLKIVLLRYALTAGYRWVAFFDADCEVRHFTPAFHKAMDTKPDGRVFMANGKSGRLNSGVIFAQSAPVTIRYFNKIIKWSKNEVPLEDTAPYENGHVIYFARQTDCVSVIDCKMWNNTVCISNKSYIQHYNGKEMRQWYLDNVYKDFKAVDKVNQNIFSKLKNRIKKWINVQKVKAVNPVDNIIRDVSYYKIVYPKLFSSDY